MAKRAAISDRHHSFKRLPFAITISMITQEPAIALSKSLLSFFVDCATAVTSLSPTAS